MLAEGVGLPIFKHLLKHTSDMTGAMWPFETTRQSKLKLEHVLHNLLVRCLELLDHQPR